MDLEIIRPEGGGSATLAVTGFIDLGTRQALVERGMALLAEEGALTLDLSAVEFMDSTGIGALIELAKACEQQGSPFAVCAVSPRARRVLEVTGLADAWSPA